MAPSAISIIEIHRLLKLSKVAHFIPTMAANLITAISISRNLLCGPAQWIIPLDFIEKIFSIFKTQGNLNPSSNQLDLLLKGYSH